MRQFSLLFSVLFVAQLVQAQRFQPVEQPIGLAEKIIVRGFEGRLQIVPSQGETLKVEAEKKGKGDLDRWTFQVRKKQNALEVVVKGPSEQESFEKWRGGQKLPHFDMKVTAPVRPLEIFWGEGEVFTKGWKSGLSLQMNNGKTKIEEGDGPLKIQLIRGRIDVAKHQGAIDIQSFKGETILTETKGTLSLNNHSAKYQLTGHQGPIRIKNHSGTISMKEVDGSSQVRNVSGVMRLRDYSGSFSGEFTRGSLDAKVKSLQSFVINSEDAAITVDAPKESGARVSIRSEKGRLWGPPYLRKIKKGRWTERKGRLKGKEQGNIKIISKYGDIVVK